MHLSELLLFFVGEVPIQVGSPEGGLHNGGSLRVFPNNEEHMMSMGTSTYDKKSLLFLSSILSFLFFLTFLICPLFSSCFLIFLIHPIKTSFHGNMGMLKYSRLSPTAYLPRDRLLGEIPQNTRRNKKRGFSNLQYFFMANAVV